jgi:hypothetical protein
MNFWSADVLLVWPSRSPEAFSFYHAEALRGGWAVGRLRRQMDSQFYERTALSRNKAAMFAKGPRFQPGDAVGSDEGLCKSPGSNSGLHCQLAEGDGSKDATLIYARAINKLPCWFT